MTIQEFMKNKTLPLNDRVLSILNDGKVTECKIIDNFYIIGKIVLDKEYKVRLQTFRDEIICKCSGCSGLCDHGLALFEYAKEHQNDVELNYIPMPSDILKNMFGPYTRRYYFDSVYCEDIKNEIENYKSLINFFLSSGNFLIGLKLFMNLTSALEKIEISDSYRYMFKNLKKDLYVMYLDSLFDNFIVFFDYLKDKNNHEYLYESTFVGCNILTYAYEDKIRFSKYNTDDINKLLEYLLNVFNDYLKVTFVYSKICVLRKAIEDLEDIKLFISLINKTIDFNVLSINIEKNSEFNACLQYLLVSNEVDVLRELYLNEKYQSFIHFNQLKIFIKIFMNNDQKDLAIDACGKLFRYYIVSKNDFSNFIDAYKNKLNIEDFRLIAGQLLQNPNNDRRIVELVGLYPELKIYQKAVNDFYFFNTHFNEYVDDYAADLLQIYYAFLYRETSRNYVSPRSFDVCRRYIGQLLKLPQGYYYAYDAVIGLDNYYGRELLKYIQTVGDC